MEILPRERRLPLLNPTLLAVLLACFPGTPVLRAQTAITYTPTFTASGINMWGSGGALFNGSYTFGTSWNETGSSGSIDTTWTGDWGARVYGSTSGEIALNVNIAATAGHVDVTLPYNVTITPSNNMAAAGTHSLDISHYLVAPASGESYMESTFASANIDVAAKLKLQATIGLEAAIFKRFGGSVQVINTDLTVPLASFANNTFSLLGEEALNLANGYTYEIKSPSSPLGVTYPWQKRLGTLSLRTPSLNAVSGNTLSTLATQQDILGVGVDPFGLAAYATSLPFNPLDLRLSIAGVASAQLVLLRSSLGVNFGLEQELALHPNLGVILRSSIPLEYQTPLGTVTTSAFVVTDLSQPVIFAKPAGEVAIFPEFFLTTTLQNRLDLLVSGFVSVEALRASFSLTGVGSLTLGPLWNETFNSPSLAPNIFSNEYTITGSGLNETYFGGSITSVTPSVGNLTAGQNLNIPGLVGVFSTDSIAGKLRLSNGSFYNNQIHLTVGPNGSLVLTSGSGPTTNYFETRGLLNQGHIEVGVGSNLSLTSSSGHFDNVDANGRLAGGTLELHGTMSYTGPGIVTNASNLEVTGELRSRPTINDGFGNALATLAVNEAGANFTLGTPLNTGRSFTNHGDVVLNSTLTATTFQNGADGALVLNGESVLQLTSPNGFLNVNPATGSLQGGMYWLRGSILYQGAGGTAGRTITDLGANTALVLAGSTSGPSISHWQPSEGVWSDALATLESNHGDFVITNGAQQTLTQAFENLGTMWVSGSDAELTVRGNFANRSGHTLNVSDATLVIQDSTFDYVFTNYGTLNLMNGGRIEVDGMLGNMSNADLDARTSELSGGIWNVGGTIAYGTGETAAPNISEITSGTTVNMLGGDFFNQFHNQSGLSYLTRNAGALFLAGYTLKSVEDLTNTGTLTVTGNSGWLGFRNTLVNTGTIVIGNGSTLSSLGTLTYEDASNWTNVAANGVLSGIGNLILAGTVEYKGHAITSLAAGNTLTLAGTEWGFDRLTSSVTSVNGLGLTSVAGSLILADTAQFATTAGQPFALGSGGNLTLTADAGFIVSPGTTLTAASGATINNDGVILLRHTGATGAVLNAAGTLTLAGTGSLQLTDSAENRLADNGGTIINSAGHSILGAGLLQTRLTNRGLIESIGAAGLTLTQPAGASLINSGRIRAGGAFIYPIVAGQYDLSQPTFVTSRVTLQDIVVTNFEGATAGRLSADSEMRLANTTVNGGRVEVATGGYLLLDDATLAVDEFTLAPLTRLDIETGRTRLAGGTLTAGFGSTITLLDPDGAASTILELNGTTAFTSEATIVLHDGTAIEGTGELRNAGAIRLDQTGATATLGANVHNTADGIINVDATTTLRLSGTFDNAGDIFVGASGATAGAALAFTADTTLTGGGEIQLGGRVSTTTGGVTTHTWAGSGHFLVPGGATVTLTNANNTISGAGTISGLSFINQSGGTVRATAPGSPLQFSPAAGGFTNAGLLAIDPDARLEFFTTGGAFTNFASHTLTGGRYEVAGVFAFNGADIHTNAADLALLGSGSVRNLTNDANALTGFVTNAAGGTFRLRAGAAFTAGNAFTNQGAVVLGGTGAAAGGTFIAPQITGNGTFTFADSTAALQVTGTGTATFSGTISGAGTLAKSGTGTQTLTGANSYAGGTTLSAGTLVAGHNSAVGTGALVLAGGTLRGDGTARTLANAVNLAANSTLGGSSNLTFTGLLTNQVAANGTLTLTNSGLTTFAALQVDPNGTGRSLVLDHSGSVSIGSIAASSGDLIKQGVGTLTLTGGGAHHGTRIYAGTLELGADGALGSSALYLHGGTLAVINGAHAFNNELYSAGSATITGTADLSFTKLRNDAAATTLTFTNTGVTSFGSVDLSTTASVNRVLTLDLGGAVNLANVVNGGGSTGSALVKRGAGLLTLSGNNTYTGGTTVQQGFVQFATAGNLGTGTVTLNGGGLRWAGGASGDPSGRLVLGANGGTLDTNGNTVNLLGGISGSGALTKTGSGTLWSVGTFTYTGGTTIEAGTLVSSNTADLPNAGHVHVAAGATLEVFQNQDVIGSLSGAGTVAVNFGQLTVGGNNASTTFSGLLTGSGAFGKEGTGTLTLSGTSDYAYSTYLSGGTLHLGAAGAFASGSELALSNSATLDLNGFSSTTINLQGTSGTSILLGSGTLTVGGILLTRTFDGVISGTGGLTRTGSGTLTLTGANTYTGATLVESGTLWLQGNDVLSGASSVNVYLAGSFLSSGSNTIGGLTGAGYVGIGQDARLTVGGSGTQNFTGLINGPGALAKTGAGTLTLTGLNTHEGGTRLQGGTLVVGHDQALGSGLLTLEGGTLGTSGGARTLGNALQLSGSVAFSGPHLITLSGAGGLTGISTLNVGTSGLTLTGALGGGSSHSLTKVGAGALTLGGDSTYAGGTVLNAGTLIAAHDNGLGTGTLRINGGTFQASGDRSLGNAIELGLSLDVSGASNLTLNGAITSAAGSTGVNKSGTGTLTLAGANAYTGGTSLAAGTLAVGHNQALGSGALTVMGGSLRSANGGHSLTNSVTLNNALTVTGSDDLVLAGVVSGTGSLAKMGTGILTLGADNTYSGGTTVFLGTVIAAHDHAFGSGGVTLSGGNLAAYGTARTIANNLTVTNHVDLITDSHLTLSGNIGGAGSLVKHGGGALALTGTNNYAGGTLVYGGTLEIFGGTSLGTGGILLDGGGLRWATGFTDTALLGLANFGTGGAIFDTNGNNVVISSNLSTVLASGARFVKAGAGTLTLTGSNSFSGGMRVDGGTLALGNANALGSSLNLLELNGGTVAAVGGARELNGDVRLLADSTIGGDQDITIYGTIRDGGYQRWLTKTGSGTLTLRAENDFTGGVRLESGILIGSNMYAFGPRLDLAGGELRTSTFFNTIVNNITLSGQAAVGGIHNITLTGIIDGTNAAATLTKTGANTLTLSGANSYAGNTRLESGTLVAASDGAFGTGTLIFAGGTLVATGGARTLNNAVEIGAGGFAFGGTSGLAFTGQLINKSGGDVTLDFANISTLGFGGAVLSDSATSRTLTVSGAGLVSFTGPIENGGTSTAGRLVKNGTGTLALSGASTYAGGTTLNAGVLSVSHGGAVGTGTLTLNGGTLMAGGTSALTNAVVLGADAHIDNAFGLELGGVLSGAALQKQGAGILTLTGTNTFGGGTTVTGGLVAFNALANFGTGGVTLDGGGVRWAGGSTLDLSPRLLAFGGGGASFDTNGNDVTLAGGLSGLGSLTKAGAGTLTLAGSNTYNGGTVLTGGALDFSSLANLGSGNLTIDGGTLRLAAGSTANNSTRLATIGASGATFDTRANSLLLVQATASQGMLVKTGSGTLELAGGSVLRGANLLNGTLTVGGNTNLGQAGDSLTFAGGGLAVNGPVTTSVAVALTAGNAGITANNGATLSLSGVVSGAGGLILGGGGRINLTGANTFAGTTQVNGAALYLETPENLGSGTAALYLTGGELVLGGRTTFDRAINLAANTAIRAAYATEGTALARLTGPISGVGHLTITGSYPFALAGTNSYSGGTYIYASTVEFSAVDNFGTGNVRLDFATLRWATGNTADISSRLAPFTGNGAAFDTNGNDVTFAASLSRETPQDIYWGDLRKYGEGVLTLTGDNDIGGVHLNGGTVAVSSISNLGGEDGVIRFYGGRLRVLADMTLNNPVDAGVGLFDVVTGATLTMGASLNSFTKFGEGTLAMGGGIPSYVIVEAGTVVSGATSRIRSLDVNQGTFVAGSADVFNEPSWNSYVELGTSGVFDANGYRVRVTGNVMGDGEFRTGSAGALIYGGGHQTSARFTGTGGLAVEGGATLLFKSGTSLATPLSIDGDLVSGSPDTVVTVEADANFSGSPLTVNEGGAFVINRNLVSVGNLAGDGLILMNTAAGSTDTRARLMVTQTGDTTFDGIIRGYGGLTKNGSGHLTIVGPQEFTGPVALNGGTVTVTDNDSLGMYGTSKISIDGATLHVANTTVVIGSDSRALELGGGGAVFDVEGASGLLVFAAGFTGSGSLVKRGAGTLRFNGTILPNAYTGGTIIEEGTVDFSSISGNVLNNGHMTAQFTGGAGGYDGVISGTGSFEKRSPSVTILTGANSYTGGTTITPIGPANNNVLSIGNGGTTGSIVGNVANNGVLRFNRSDNVSFAGIISGTGNLQKRGAGLLTLTGANTYTGTTTIQDGGGISFAADTALGTAPATATASRITLNNGRLETTATFTLNANRGITLGANGGTFAPASGTTLTYGGIIAGAGAFIKAGAGTLVLSGANTYTGTNTITGGLVQLDANTRLGSGALTLNGGGIRYSAAFDNLRAFTLGTGGALFDTNSFNVSYGEAITGGGGLTKLGLGILTLSGANIYTGGTTVSAGSLQLDADSRLGSGTLLLNGGGVRYGAAFDDLRTFTLGANGARLDTNGYHVTYGQAITGTGSLTKDGAGTLTLTADNSHGGGTTIAAGTLQLGNGGTVGSILGNILDNAALVFNRLDDVIYAGDISGSGSVTKQGAGRLTLAGTNTYGGTTTVSAGRLHVTGSASNSAFTVAGGTLSGSGSIGALTLGAGGILAPGASPGTLSAASTVWNGGGTYQWEINNGTGVLGVNWDLLSITGSLTIGATSGNPFSLLLQSLTTGNTAGNVINFNPTTNHAYTIASASGGIIGFDSSAFVLNTGGFTNANTGSWRLAQSGNNLDLVFTAIPEPSTYAALAGAAALALAAWRRRQRRAV